MRLPIAVLAVALVALSACREEEGEQTLYPGFGPGFEAQAEERCQSSGGTWGPGGSPGTMACFRETGDGGTSCDSADDCKGLCLARSRTCAPITPLFGCNEVLGTGGERSTLCID